ncbi:MAG: MFS transporter [Planctomycetes bacterium]|nr:MFS transporter [Planctomycetota bacterium]
MIKSSPYVLFVGCFIAIVTTAFGFLLRAMLMDGWAAEFHFSETQKGELFGVGLWPFAISIVLFSLIIDKIGYKTAMIFGFVCHMASLAMTVTATSYEGLYWANFVVALGNGTVEAYANPVVATQFSKDKARWLNILHAGWPGGMVIAGLIALAMGDSVGWKAKIMLLAIPAIAYFVILLFQKFPINERVAAGVSYRDMLKEVGALGAFIITWLISVELSRSAFHAESPLMVGTIAAAIVGIGFFAAVRSLGRPLFIFMLLIMVPLATTELGVDSWVTGLLGPALATVGLKGVFVLLYTSLLMMILRFCAGPIIHRISPLGVLASCAALAAVGLFLLSTAHSWQAIFAFATVYAMGKSFFWPTMLGVVSEQCPKGGALALNATGGVGMLGVGVLGAMIMGNIQDHAIDSTLKDSSPKVHEQVMVDKTGLLGSYHAVDDSKVAALAPDDQKAVGDARETAKYTALRIVSILPVLMLVCYLILIFYFRSRGGYKPVDAAAAAH